MPTIVHKRDKRRVWGVACGQWAPYGIRTTTHKSKVTCKKCLAAIAGKGKTNSMTKTLEELSSEERSLLLYLEARAVDNYGLVDTAHMNSGDMEIAKRWNDEGFIYYGRIHSSIMPSTAMRHSCPTHYVELTDNAWKLAHAERIARYKRNKNWRTRTLEAKEE